MKNLLYIFKIKNNEGEIIFSTNTDSRDKALFFASMFLYLGYFPIKAPAEILDIDILDYDC